MAHSIALGLCLLSSLLTDAGPMDPVVVLLGDSTTLSRRSEVGDKYADALRVRLNPDASEARTQVINSGLGSDTAQNALARIDKDVAAYDPDIVAVSFGLNDLSRRSSEEFNADLTRLIDAIRARTRADVILCTSTPFDDRHSRALKPPYTEPGSLDATIESKMNSQTRLLAHQRRLPLCDQHARFAKAIQNRGGNAGELLRPDGVHLTPAGNRLMAENLAPLIEATLKERNSPKFPGLLPRPKIYREMGPPLLLASKGEKITLFLIDETSREGHDSHPMLAAAQADLDERLKRDDIEIAPNTFGIMGPIQIRVGPNFPPTPPASWTHSPTPQGYSLTVRQSTMNQKATIFIAATDPEGAFYAIQSLLQLLESTPAGVTVRQAFIDDWPTFTFRSFKGQCWYYRDNRMFARWLDRFKWNVLGPCYTDSPNWREPSDAYGSMIGDLCDRARSRGTFRVMQLGNPFMVKEQAIRAGSDADIEKLADFFELSLGRGSDVLMLCLDDFAFLPAEDQERFGSMGRAHASMVTRFAERIRAHHGTRILLCPPPYWLPTKDKDRVYLNELSAGIPEDIAIVWTGRYVTTVRHEAADIEAYQKLIGQNRQLFLWDNTLKMPPGWSNVFRMNAFLADCPDLSTSAWPDLAKFTAGEAVINTYGPGQIYKVPLMTAADYLWNPERYDPQDSLRRALYLFDANPDVGPMVYRWINSLHQRLFTLRQSFLEKPGQETLDEMSGLIADYEALYGKIAEATDNRTLVAELEPYLLRHVRAMPIWSKVLKAMNQAPTDLQAARQGLEQAEAELKALTDQLGMGDQSEDVHGLVRQWLEINNLKALAKLKAGLTP